MKTKQKFVSSCDTNTQETKTKTKQKNQPTKYKLSKKDLNRSKKKKMVKRVKKSSCEGDGVSGLVHRNHLHANGCVPDARIRGVGWFAKQGPTSAGGELSGYGKRWGALKRTGECK